MYYLSLFALIAGVAIAAQATMNAHLGALLNNVLLATTIAFASSLLFVSSGLILFTKNYPSIEAIKSVPYYLWFSGGLLSAIAIATFYWLIPKMGIGPMMSFALTGQLILSIIASHYGWFQLPITQVTLTKLIGIACLIAGIYLINFQGGSQ